MDVDDDSLFIIFDYLKTTEVMILSKIPQFSPVVTMVLRQRFHKLTIVIKGADVQNFNHVSKQYKCVGITETTDSISIERFRTAAAVLRTFGYLIKNLGIKPFHGWSEKNVEHIFELINLHCSETVKMISFHESLDENVFNKLTVPFKAVEKVELMCRSNNEILLSSEIGFSRIFPALRHLYMDSYNILDSPDANTTDYVMPHLEYLHRTFGTMGEDHLDGTLFGNIIKNNPQISNIFLKNCNAKFLEFLSLHAPNLEYLKFQYFYHEHDDDYTNIRFDKLKKIKALGYSLPRPFVCDNLEELMVESTIGLPDILKFIASRGNLKRFQCNGFLDNYAISSLASSKLDVYEAQLDCKFSVKAENIIQFVESSPNLMKLQLSMYDSETKMRLQQDISELLPNLAHKWTIEVSKDIILSKQIYWNIPKTQFNL